MANASSALPSSPVKGVESDRSVGRGRPGRDSSTWSGGLGMRSAGADASAGSMTTESGDCATATVAVPEAPLALAVIVVVPLPAAVTSPEPSTVATAALPLDQVTVAPVHDLAVLVAHFGPELHGCPQGREFGGCRSDRDAGRAGRIGSRGRRLRGPVPAGVGPQRRAQPGGGDNEDVTVAHAPISQVLVQLLPVARARQFNLEAVPARHHSPKWGTPAGRWAGADTATSCVPLRQLRALPAARCGSARPETPGPANRSRFHPAACRPSNPRDSCVAKWREGTASPPEEPGRRVIVHSLRNGARSSQYSCARALSLPA